MKRGGCIYIMTNKHRTTIYIGVTSELKIRVYQHRTHYYPQSFTAKYGLECFVYYESFQTIEEAISREKELKKWRKSKKYDLINTFNPEWNDLWGEIKDW